MDDPNRELSPSGTQFEDIPSCLILDILSRLPMKSLVISVLVCKSWFNLFSEPMFVELHRARSPSYLFFRKPGEPSYLFLGKPGEPTKFRCTYLAREIPGENFEFKKSVTLPDSEFTCVNSCNGLLCLDTCKSRGDEIYVCNPVLGEYITIPVANRDTERWSVLGFCSRSNQFKVLQISGSTRIAKIYTIGNGTRSWRTIGMAPSCTVSDYDPVNSLSCTVSDYDPVNSFLNGSIHWMDGKTLGIFYFNFETEKFGKSLPSPPAWLRERLSKFKRVRLGVVRGFLCIYPEGRHFEILEVWIMKESWTRIFAMYCSKKDGTLELKPLLCSSEYGLTELGTVDTIYNPSFISLQDVARGERLTVMSRTRIGRDLGICDQVSNIGTGRDLVYDNAHPGVGVNPLIRGSNLFSCRRHRDLNPKICLNPIPNRKQKFKKKKKGTVSLKAGGFGLF